MRHQVMILHEELGKGSPPGQKIVITVYLHQARNKKQVTSNQRNSL